MSESKGNTTIKTETDDAFQSSMETSCVEKPVVEEPKKPKKEPSPLLKVFQKPKTQPNLKERRQMFIKEEYNKKCEAQKQEDEKRVAEKLAVAKKEIEDAQRRIAVGLEKKLSLINKSVFKCLQMPDGSTYYGQVIQILPHHLKPQEGGMPAGFLKKSPQTALSRTSSADLAGNES